MVQAYDSAHLSDALLDVPHPLEPLTAEEITAAVDIVRTEKQLSQFVRFASVTLHEPPKQIVLQYKPGDAYSREAELVLMDDEHRAVYEGVVSLTESKVTSWKQVLGVQPPVLMDEFFECEQVVKADPQYQEALRKRGITNVDLVMVDPWSPGYYGPDDDPKNRIIQALSWVRADEKDNGYAHPIEGLLAFVDMNARKVIRIEDYENVPLPSEAGNYTADAIGKFRDDLKPLEVVQPEGPSFSIKGHEIHWQKWSLRIGFTPREGLVLYTVGYEDQGRV
ncbi:MAG: tyramine oxidase, partial [Ktedonobacteraceae bacterium]